MRSIARCHHAANVRCLSTQSMNPFRGEAEQKQRDEQDNGNDQPIKKRVMIHWQAATTYIVDSEMTGAMHPLETPIRGGAPVIQHHQWDAEQETSNQIVPGFHCTQFEAMIWKGKVRV